MKAPRASSEHDDANKDERRGYSVQRFADAHDISRSQAFEEIASGRLIARVVGGGETPTPGAGKTIITCEDAARWRRSLPKRAAKRVPKKASDGLGPSESRAQTPNPIGADQK
jgi:hypothetical protein